jgi:hypothetical protein
LVFGFWFLVFGFWFLVFGFWLLVFGFCFWFLVFVIVIVFFRFLFRFRVWLVSVSVLFSVLGKKLKSFKIFLICKIIFLHFVIFILILHLASSQGGAMAAVGPIGLAKENVVIFKDCSIRKNSAPNGTPSLFLFFIFY